MSVSNVIYDIVRILLKPLASSFCILNMVMKILSIQSAKHLRRLQRQMSSSRKNTRVVKTIVLKRNVKSITAMKGSTNGVTMTKLRVLVPQLYCVELNVYFKKFIYGVCDA